MREDRDDEKTANASEEVPQRQDSQGETSSTEKVDLSGYNGFGGG